MGWSAYILGYLFAVAVGGLLLGPVTKYLWQAVDAADPSRRGFRPDAWQPAVLGLVERAIYVTVLLLHHPEFIGVWLALKVAGQWDRWKDAQLERAGVPQGRSVFQNFLIASGLSVLFALAGYSVICGIGRGARDLAAIPAAALLVSTGALWLWLRLQSRRQGAA